MLSRPASSRFTLSLTLLVLAALACNLPGSTTAPTLAPLPPSPTAGQAATQAPAEPSATLAAPTDAGPVETAASPATSGEPVVIDPCTLLTQTEATDLLGVIVGPGQINTNICIYTEPERGVYVVSAYALPGETRRGFLFGRVMQLAGFGLAFDQPTLDWLKQQDQAADHLPALQKMAELSAQSSAFTSRTISGLGDFAMWGWKSFGPEASQGFLIATRGEVTAGIDLVHGSNLTEAQAAQNAEAALRRLFERLPADFTLAAALPSMTPAPPADQPTPTWVGDLPTPTWVGGLATPTLEGGGSGVIAFQSDRDGGENLYLMNLDGINPRPLTTDRASYAPAWAPDGQRIAFYSLASGEVELRLLSLAGGSAQTLAPGYIIGRPAWSPDGVQIAFTDNANGDLDIMLVSASGAGLANLTYHPASDYAPSWSPDGSRLVFVSDREGERDLFLYDFRNGGVSRLVTTARGVGEPAWSPTGEYFAFTCIVPGSPYGQICRIRPDGSEFVALTANQMDNKAPGRVAGRGVYPVLRRAVPGELGYLEDGVQRRESGEPDQPSGDGYVRGVGEVGGRVENRTCAPPP